MNKKLKYIYKQILEQRIQNKLFSEAVAPPRIRSRANPSGSPSGPRIPIVPHGYDQNLYPTTNPDGTFYIPLKQLFPAFGQRYGTQLNSFNWWEQLMRINQYQLPGAAGKYFVDGQPDLESGNAWLREVENKFRRLIALNQASEIAIMMDGRVCVKNPQTGKWHWLNGDGSLQTNPIPNNPDGSEYNPGSGPIPGETLPPPRLDEFGNPNLPQPWQQGGGGFAPAIIPPMLINPELIEPGENDGWQGVPYRA